MSRPLERLEGGYAVCRLDPSAAIPAWAAGTDGLVSITRSAEELSIICLEAAVPGDVERSGGWAALRVTGTIPHDVTGVLAAISASLAAAGIPLFAISSFDTDYVLVPAAKLQAAVGALADAGYEIR